MIHRLATLEEILPLRAAILRPGLPLVDAVFAGDDDPQTCHFATLDEDRVVGCLSLMRVPINGTEAWQLRGMAVAEECRGTGVGRSLLELACTAAGAKGPNLMWCNARSQAVGFYQKQGWTVVSEEFVIQGVGPHFRMSWERGGQ